MRRLALAVVAALVACSPPPRAETASAPPASDAAPALTAEVIDTGAAPMGADAAGADATPVADAGAVTKKAACPASFAAAQTAVCILGDQPSECTYPAGDCGCVSPPQCGGAYRPTPPGSPGRWRCDPKSPGTLRFDGCSFAAPPHGAPCATDGKTCRWGDCSWSQTLATCKGGKWAVTHKNGPPPP